MEDEIYQPPRSNIETNEPLTGSPVTAIALATVIDLVGTILSGIALTIAYSAIMASRGLSQDAITQKLQNIEKLSLFSLSGVAIGCAITMYAGYFCARRVNYSEYKFVSIYGAISILMGFVMGGYYYSAWDLLILSALTVISALTGAWLHVRKKT